MLKLTKLLLLISCLMLASSVAAQSMLTLEDAIALGLKNNYDIRIARNQAKISANSKGIGLSGFLPTLDAGGSYSKTDSEAEVDLPPGTTNTDMDNLSAQLSMNWTIFDGFKMFVNRKKFNELAKLGEYQARNRIENSIVAISEAYFNLVQQEQLLQVAHDVRNISETRLRRERVRNELGGASNTDFLNAQVSFNSDQSSLLNQQLAVTVAIEQLNLLLGQDPATEFAVSTEIVIPELVRDYSEILHLALERNSSLMASELSKKVADREAQSARSPFLPRLSAFASYGYGDQTLNRDVGDFAGLDVGTKTISTTVGLSLSYNLFNGTRDKVALQNAKLEANNEALALRDARNRLTGLVQQTWDTYRQRMEVVALEEQNIQAARQNLDLQRERQELGVANSLEFRDAQVSFVRSQTSLITARYQARISRLVLEKLMGALEVGLVS